MPHVPRFCDRCCVCLFFLTQKRFFRLRRYSIAKENMTNSSADPGLPSVACSLYLDDCVNTNLPNSFLDAQGKCLAHSCRKFASEHPRKPAYPPSLDLIFTAAANYIQNLVKSLPVPPPRDPARHCEENFPQFRSEIPTSCPCAISPTTWQSSISSLFSLPPPSNLYGREC